MKLEVGWPCPQHTTARRQTHFCVGTHTGPGHERSRDPCQRSPSGRCPHSKRGWRLPKVWEGPDSLQILQGRPWGPHPSLFPQLPQQPGGPYLPGHSRVCTNVACYLICGTVPDAAPEAAPLPAHPGHTPLHQPRPLGLICISASLLCPRPDQPLFCTQVITWAPVCRA